VTVDGPPPALPDLAFDQPPDSPVGAGPDVAPDRSPDLAVEAPSAQRDPRLKPFAVDSIWNVAVGSGAVFVPSQLKAPTYRGPYFPDNFLLLDAAAPVVDVFKRDQAAPITPACQAKAEVLFSSPVPVAFVVPSSLYGAVGSFVMLQADGRTLIGGNHLIRCASGGPVSADFKDGGNGDLRGDGIAGGEPFSGLSALGGTIRLGELVRGAPPIRHALKLALHTREGLFPCTTFNDCYRWPARWAQGGAVGTYANGPPAMKMGALLALPSTAPAGGLGLETEAAKSLAWTLQNYGAYVAYDTYSGTYGFMVEAGTAGRVADEFEQSWGFALSSDSRDTPWSRDITRLVTGLSVVDNNARGTIGGGGTPRQPPAAPLAP
jgi:hypothetical protein